MKTSRILLALALLAIPSCTLSTDCVCVEGPNKGAVIRAKFFYAGTGSGKVTAVAPWGETLTGRYLTQIDGMKAKTWETNGHSTGNSLLTEGESATITANGSTQVGTVTMLGSQGTVWDLIYWGNVFSPTHGQGRGKDSRGNRYRMVW
jgi:hypothetical protein